MEVLSVLNGIQLEYISRVNKLLWGIALWACGTYHWWWPPKELYRPHSHNSFITSDDLQSCMDSLAPTSHIVLFNASHILPIYSLSIIENLVDNKLIDMSAVEYVLPKHVTNWNLSSSRSEKMVMILFLFIKTISPGLYPQCLIC